MSSKQSGLPAHKQANQYSARAIYKRLLSYSKPYFWVFLVAILGMFLAAAANGFFVKQVEPLIEQVFGQGSDKAKIWVPLLIFLAVTGRAIGTVIGNYGMDYVAMSIIRDIRQQLFEKYLYVPSASHDKSASGEALGKVIYNVGLLSYSASKAITVLIGESLTAIYLLFLMISMSPKLVLVFFSLVPIMAFFVRISNRAVRRYSTRIQNSMGDVAQSVNEILSAHRVMKVFGGQGTESQRFGQINGYNREQELKLAAVRSLVSPMVQILLGVTLGLIVYIAASDWMGEPMSAGQFMAFFLAMAGLFSPVRSLTKVNLEIQRGITAAQSVFEVLDSESEQDTGTHALKHAKGDVCFEQVGFTYSDHEGAALEDINLQVGSGNTVAFVGQSGSGKTTLVSLLPRFYEVGSGKISLDNIDLRDIPLTDLRRQISYVGQDLRLFDDTVRNNIAYGELAGSTDEEVWAAVEAAHAKEFIKALPDGLNSLVGDGGSLLSGGQRQRISIARALLKNSPILILDEATSALDTESERGIQDALSKLVKNRTTFVIAHRLSTIENADLIVVMEQGRILEQGSHDELLAKNGAYARLHGLQFGTRSGEMSV